jgi:DNA-binding MarR family transcriptional regulator
MQSEQVLDQLLLVTDTLAADMTRYLSARGLTTPKAHVLWSLRSTGPSMQRRLSTDLGYSPRHITDLVDDLVALGLVQREPHPDDRRAVLVTLTEQGSRLLTELEEERAQFASQLFDHLDDPARGRLHASLTDIQARLQAALEEAGA